MDEVAKTASTIHWIEMLEIIIFTKITNLKDGQPHSITSLI
jgi:hypothetical protein